MDVNELDLLYDQDRQEELLLKRWKPWLSAEADDKYGKLKTERQKMSMAILLESQWQWQKKALGSQIMADTATSDEALITRVALPIVRRVYAQIFQGPWSSVQPLTQPSSYVFWLDFQRELDSPDTNMLSVEYNYAIANEGGVPAKMKLALAKRQINTLKELMAFSWSQEAEEDLRAVLGLNAEDELMNAGTGEFMRNLLGRHLKEINNAARSGTSDGTLLTAPWNANLAVTTIPAQGSDSVSDYKQRIYNYLQDANTRFQRANRRPATGIVAGYGLAGLFQKMNTATATDIVDDDNLASVGITNYGSYAGRFNIQATDFLPDDQGFLYREDADPLFSGHVYAPYIPITAMPKVYASFDATSGAYANTDTWTRNIRERSASTVVKPYAYAAISAASLTF